MADTRHRDVWRVWYTLDGSDTEMAYICYAVDYNDAVVRAEAKLSGQLPGRVITIVSAEPR